MGFLLIVILCNNCRLFLMTSDACLVSVYSWHLSVCIAIVKIDRLLLDIQYLQRQTRDILDLFLILTIILMPIFSTYSTPSQSFIIFEKLPHTFSFFSIFSTLSHSFSILAHFLNFCCCFLILMFSLKIWHFYKNFTTSSKHFQAFSIFSLLFSTICDVSFYSNLQIRFCQLSNGVISCCYLFLHFNK